MDALYFCGGILFTLVGLYVLAVCYPTKPKENQLTIEFEGQAKEQLENLRVLTEKTDCINVVCCALATYKTLQLAIKDGKTVALIDNNTKEYNEVLLP